MGLDSLTSQGFWWWFQWGTTVAWLFWVLQVFLVIRNQYRTSSRGIVALREVYDSIILKAEAEADASAATLAAQEQIEIDDTKNLLARRAGIGRKLKLHDRCRRERERLRLMLEEAKSRTESLPIIGILGTMFGLCIASLGSASIVAITSGIWIALTSSIFALSFMLVIKHTWEARVLSQLENLEDREALVFEYVALREDVDLPEPAK